MFYRFIGVAPPSFIAIQAGTTLQQMTSTTDALSVQSIALLVVFAFLSILPAILKNRYTYTYIVLHILKIHLFENTSIVGVFFLKIT